MSLPNSPFLYQIRSFIIVHLSSYHCITIVLKEYNVFYDQDKHWCLPLSFVHAEHIIKQMQKGIFNGTRPSQD